MKLLITTILVMTLSACGLESAGTAAVAGKMKAEQAKQGQKTVENVKANIETSMQTAQEAQRKLEEQASK